MSLHWTAADVAAVTTGQPPNPKRNKYGVSPANQRTVDGVVFASKRESQRYAALKLLVNLGRITDLKLQPRFVLQEAFQDAQGHRHRAIEYVGDFSYLDGGKRVVEDVKGMKTPAYRLKVKLLLARHRDIEFREVR